MAGKKRKDEEHPEEALGRVDAAGVGSDAAATERPLDSSADGSTVDAEVGDLRAELDELNGKWKRALADLDNYRKRVERDRLRWSEAAREQMALDLLEVVDNLERALACGDADFGDADGGGENGSLRQGVELILKHLVDVLAKHGVTPIATDGCEFDPNIHEAVGSVETDECDPNHVVEETQKGYRLGDKLLRCPKVIVAK
jgi:molecular chaperone GrpE